MDAKPNHAQKVVTLRVHDKRTPTPEQLNAIPDLPLPAESLVPLAQYIASELGYDERRATFSEVALVAARGTDSVPKGVRFVELVKMVWLECAAQTEARSLQGKSPIPHGISDEDKDAAAIAIANHYQSPVCIDSLTPSSDMLRAYSFADAQDIRHRAVRFAHEARKSTVARKQGVRPDYANLPAEPVMPPSQDFGFYGNAQAIQQGIAADSIFEPLARAYYRVHNFFVGLFPKPAMPKVHRSKWSRTLAIVGAGVFAWFSADKAVSDGLAQFRKANNEPLGLTALQAAFCVIGVVIMTAIATAVVMP